MNIIATVRFSNNFYWTTAVNSCGLNTKPNFTGEQGCEKSFAKNGCGMHSL
jgi:hypothetical protein